MNTQMRPLHLHDDTVSRRRWRASELERAIETGVIGHDERIELIDGEVVVMAAKGRRHEIVRTELTFYWSKRCPDDVVAASEPAFLLDEHNEPEPDMILFPRTLYAPDVRGDTVLLVVEISDSSLSYDLTVKATLYAAFGVTEYWVIDAKSLTTTIHRQPADDSYALVSIVPPTHVIQPVCAPALGLKLADLGLPI
jgi:Uma2 family endonuclease